jgi:hypothetical protein
VHWLDDRRILFTAPANASKDGVAEYRESGWRRDLVLHDLGLRTTDRVTDVADGVFLDVATALTDTVVATRRSLGESLATFSLYDTESWREVPSGLTRGTDICVSADGARAAILRSDDQLSEVIIRSRRSGVAHAAPVLVTGRITGASWSPDARSLAVSTMAADGHTRLTVIAHP